jgi:hypothetical protein
MPPGYIHAAQTLFAYGRTYFDEHQEKDAAHQILGRHHRSENHDWYHAYGTLWDFDHPVPDWLGPMIERFADDHGDDAAEIYQAIYFSHDFADRVNDGAAPIDQKRSAAFHIFLLWHPEIIEVKFQVDVIKGRIDRVIDGQEIWETSPETVQDYERLRHYVERVLENDAELQRMVAACDAHYRKMLREGRWG